MNDLPTWGVTIATVAVRLSPGSRTLCSLDRRLIYHMLRPRSGVMREPEVRRRATSRVVRRLARVMG